MSRSKVVDTHSARTPEYRKTLERIAKDGKCPFCPENFIHHKGKILMRHGGWFLVRNMLPYKNARIHLLIICERHVESLSELSAGDFTKIMELMGWASVRYRINGGAFMMRFGDTRFTGATVCHLHAHVIVPKLNTKTRRAEVVNFPVG